MSDLNSVCKRLTIKAARVITEEEAAGAFLPLTKYFHVVPTRPIEEIPVTITLPANYITQSAYLAAHFPRLIFQYNVIMPGPFNVLKHIVIHNQHYYNESIVDGSIVAKWREGATVYRYWIKGNTSAYNVGQTLFFPSYTTATKLIGQNVCFEFWYSGKSTVAAIGTGLFHDVKLLTSALVCPCDNGMGNLTSLDLTATELYQAGGYTRTGSLVPIAGDLGNTLPWTMPHSSDEQDNLIFE